jgi:glycine cleavage system aminomethyltransferase T
MNTDTTPIEASLLWAISKVRRADGARAGGFPAPSDLRPAAHGVARKRVGLLPQERTPVREGADIVDANDKPVGKCAAVALARHSAHLSRWVISIVNMLHSTPHCLPWCVERRWP